MGSSGRRECEQLNRFVRLSAHYLNPRKNHSADLFLCKPMEMALFGRKWVLKKCCEPPPRIYPATFGQYLSECSHQSLGQILQ